MAYKNNELIIYCKYCKTRKKLRARSHIHPNGNFCSRDCHRKYLQLNAQDDEEKQAKWNVYQNEYKKNKLHSSPEYIRNRKKKHIRVLIRILKRRLNVLKKSFVCEQCGKKFSGYNRVYCSKKCYIKSSRSSIPLKERKKKWRRNGNGGIKRVAFDKMRAEYNYTCPKCGEREPFDQYWPYLVQDHIIPRSKGGRKRCKDNIQPLCWDCNNKKSDKYE